MSSFRFPSLQSGNRASYSWKQRGASGGSRSHECEIIPRREVAPIDSLKVGFCTSIPSTLFDFLLLPLAPLLLSEVLV